jgi:putative tricarboxylic transport membrane protein
MLTKELYLALGVVLFSIVSYIGSIPYPHNSAYFPRFIIFLIGFLGCVMSIKEIRKNRQIQSIKKIDAIDAGDDIPLFQQPAFFKVTVMMVASAFYLLAIDWVGFFSSAIVYLPIMMWVLGVRKIRTIVTGTIVVVFFIFLIFSIFLKVPFPQGILI